MKALVEPFEVTLPEQWREANHSEALRGKQDELIKPERKGMVYGLITKHPANVPYFIVLDGESFIEIQVCYCKIKANKTE